MLAILSGLMLTGGCVAQTKYDDALAANRRAQMEIEQLNEALRKLRAENKDLLAQLEAARAGLAKLQADYDALKAQYDKLKSDYDELLAKFTGLTNVNPVKLPDPIALPSDLDAELRKLAEENPGLFTYYPKYGMIKLNADLTFAPGSDDVNPSAKPALQKFAKIMDSATASKFNIYVAGHTDDIRIAKPETLKRHPNNWYLSVHRAVSVVKELSTAGLAQARMGAMGFGEYHPVAPNAPGNKGNVANRRVEIWVVSPNRFLTVAGDPGPAVGGEAK